MQLPLKLPLFWDSSALDVLSNMPDMCYLAGQHLRDAFEHLFNDMIVRCE